MNIFLLTFGILGLAYADLPIHCTRSQVIGEWSFHIKNEMYPTDIRDKRVACGNGFPNQ